MGCSMLTELGGLLQAHRSQRSSRGINGPGTYDVEVSYIGYSSIRITDVIAQALRANQLDVQLESGSIKALVFFSIHSFPAK